MRACPSSEPVRSSLDLRQSSCRPAFLSHPFDAEDGFGHFGRFAHATVINKSKKRRVSKDEASVCKQVKVSLSVSK